MKTYIERETLLTHAIALNNPYELGENVVPVSDIEDAPAADVETVRHGQWLSVCGCIVRCDLCRNEAAGESNYCPNCGAKMNMEDK